MGRNALVSTNVEEISTIAYVLINILQMTLFP